MFRLALKVIALVTMTAPSLALDLRDPTQPPTVHQSAVRRLEIKQPTHYAVSVIKISGDERKALINGQFVSEGESIGEARVVSIAADAVVLEYLSEERRLSLLPQQVRRNITGP